MDIKNIVAKALLKTVSETYQHHETSFDHLDFTKDEHWKQIADVQKNHEDFSSHPDHHVPTTDLQEKVSVSRYQGTGARSMNGYLLGITKTPTGPNDLTHINHICNWISKGKPLQQDTHVYSGLGFNPKEHIKDNVIYMPAFTSSAIDPHIAKDFADRNSENNNLKHILHFHLPKGYNKGRYIPEGKDNTGPFYHGEREFLLDKNQKFKITHHEQNNGYHIWHAIPHDDKPLTEAYKHNPKNKVFKDFTSYGIDNFFNVKNSAMHKKEHTHLSSLHTIDKNDPHILDKIDALKCYTTDSPSINNPLINKKIKMGYREKITHKDLLTIFDSHKPLQHEHHVYSGLGKFDPSKLIEKGKGVFKSPAYISTSLNPAVAATHTNTAQIDYRLNEDHILHFHLPKGYMGGHYVGSHSGFENEHEMLLRPNQKFKVTNHEVIDGVRKKTQYVHNHNGRDTRATTVKTPTKRHIWTVVPMEHLGDKPLKESFDHNESNEFLNNSDQASPAVEQIIPKYKEEHEILSNLHDKTTFKHRKSLRIFTGASQDLNDEMIKGKSLVGFHKTVHEDLTNMFNSIPAITHEHHVYTGLGNFNPHEHFKHPEGFTNPSYLSTSISPEVAIQHSNLKRIYDTEVGAQPKDEHVLHFKLPVGYKNGAYIANQSMFKGEHEMLLKPAQKFKLINHSKYNINDKNTTRHIWTVEPHE